MGCAPITAFQQVAKLRGSKNPVRRDYCLLPVCSTVLNLGRFTRLTNRMRDEFVMKSSFSDSCHKDRNLFQKLVSILGK